METHLHTDNTDPGVAGARVRVTSVTPDRQHAGYSPQVDTVAVSPRMEKPVEHARVPEIWEWAEYF